MGKVITGKVPSPCISVCTMNEESGYCNGCFRTLEEIAAWEKYSDKEKREVLKRLEERRDSFPKDNLY